MNSISLFEDHIHTGNLILVNQDHEYRAAAEDQLFPVCDSDTAVRMKRSPTVLFTNLMDKLQAWDQIVPVSGWRSPQEQQDIFQTSLADSGRKFTEKYVAAPGHSEHETGLAIDLGLKQPSIDFIRPEFPYTGICQAFREKAADYGFVERYPAGKEPLTGIGHEPWHFRYVGVLHAAIMVRLGMVLEEYIAFLKQYPYGTSAYRREGMAADISYQKAGPDGCTHLELRNQHPCSISGNNMDGYIITEWRGNYGSQTKLPWA